MYYIQIVLLLCLTSKIEITPTRTHKASQTVTVGQVLGHIGRGWTVLGCHVHKLRGNLSPT